MEKRVIFLGLSGFPFGMAAISKQKLLARSLMIEGWNAIVLNVRSVHSEGIIIQKVGKYKGIQYRYLFNPYRSKSLFIRNFRKLISPFLEFLILKKLVKGTDIVVGIVSNSNSFINSAWYYFLSRIFKFKIVHNTAELYINRPGTSLLRRINNSAFNRYGLYFFDGYIPISNFILDYFKNRHKDYHYIPTITDISVYDNINPFKKPYSYFVYCGSAAYFNGIEFIIKAFKVSKLSNSYKIILVTAGTAYEMDRINNCISKYNLNDRIEIQNKLSDNELFSFYKGSVGLLLPMFNTIQDKARFPHKLSEYLASGCVVLSSPIGEVGKHLKNKESVLFSKVGDINEFSDNMRWVVQNPKEAQTYGQKGKELCELMFNYKGISREFDSFLLRLFDIE